jgi:nicotinate phosphoribosyltransferase
MQMDSSTNSDEAPPTAGVRMQVRHPFVESKRAFVTPTKVEVLLQLVWDGWRSIGSTAKTPAEQQLIPTPSLDERRARCMSQVQSLRADHLRFVLPCPYKVSLTENLYKYTHDMWLANAPVPDL